MSRRTKDVNKALNKNNFKRVAQWKLDYDYVDKLSKKDKAWLAKFSKEYYDASYTEWAGIVVPIHPMDATRKDGNRRAPGKSNKSCNANNNAQNRDLFSIMFPKGIMKSMDAQIAQIVVEEEE